MKALAVIALILLSVGFFPATALGFAWEAATRAFGIGVRIFENGIDAMGKVLN